MSSEPLKQRHALPENNQCLTCFQTSQNHYVCLDFGTFICGVCASIHRELGFRVKAINLSKFTPEEIDSISGNGVIRKNYYARWDPNSEPIPSVTQKEELKQFIIKALIEKKWHIATQPPPTSYPPSVYQPAKLPQQVSIPSSYNYTPQPKPETIPVSIENPNLRGGGFAVKTFESPSIKPPYFDLSKPTNVITPTQPPESNPQNPNLLADWGYKPPVQPQPQPQFQPQPQPHSQPQPLQYISPPQHFNNNPYAVEPIAPVYDQKPQILKPPDLVQKADIVVPNSAAFPFYQQPQRPPPRPVQPVIEKPPQVISPPPSQPVVSPPTQQVSMVLPPTQPAPVVSRPPSYITQELPGQVPGSMHGSFIQYASPQPVVYPAYPQKLPQANPVPQQVQVFNGPTGGYVMLPQGVMLQPQAQVMAMAPQNRGYYNPVAAQSPPKNSIVVVQQQPPPNTVIPTQQRVQYVPSTIPQTQQQQQYYQPYQEAGVQGYANDVNQKKKQIEDDEALARRLQEEENRNAYN